MNRPKGIEYRGKNKCGQEVYRVNTTIKGVRVKSASSTDLAAVIAQLRQLKTAKESNGLLAAILIGFSIIAALGLAAFIPTL